LSHPEPKSGMRLLCSGNLVPGNTKYFFDCGWALFGNRAAEKQRRRGEGVY